MMPRYSLKCFITVEHCDKQPLSFPNLLIKSEYEFSSTACFPPPTRSSGFPLSLSLPLS
ncbi:hypothetical protein HanRHA438_Chr11g0493241 [Helianthus annuus]|nr:hypothetical protein HanRHA438_Chr11g0493241 [Helianthus annuus]